jgi:NAD(P)-dependent dehydrogenase (short-subunit alcohol dehydrogenase family)
VSFSEQISYAGKRVVVTGAASGMGNATIKYLAELGAEILALDINEVEAGDWKFIQVDLAERSSVDAAVSAIGSPVNALFNIAGHAGGRGREKQAMMVNFYGHRHLTERLLPAMPRGSAIVNVSSLAGFRYFMAEAQEVLKPMLELATMEQASAWLDQDDNQDKFNGYGTSKELQNLWTTSLCQQLAAQYGIRINGVAPGTTDTPLLDAFRANAVERGGSADAVDSSRGFLARFAHAEDQAAACVFLNSDAASIITGQVLAVDGGMTGAMMGGTRPMPGIRTR